MPIPTAIAVMKTTARHLPGTYFQLLGFYPVCPGTDQYVLGAPLFRSVRLHLENGKTVTIEAPENSRANRYVQKLTVDGVDYTRNYLTHGQLMNGSSLRFTMDNVPNKQRGAGEEDAPYSLLENA